MQMDLRKYTKWWVWGIYTPLFSDSPIVYQSLWIDLDNAGHRMQVLVSAIGKMICLWPLTLVSTNLALLHHGYVSKRPMFHYGLKLGNHSPFFEQNMTRLSPFVNSWIKSQCFMAKAPCFIIFDGSNHVKSIYKSLWGRFWGDFFPLIMISPVLNPMFSPLAG